MLFSRIALIAIVCLTCAMYGASIADADGALCFGRDGHTSKEGSPEHRPAASSAVNGVSTTTDHGACVDVTMLARDGDTGHAVLPTPIGAPAAAFMHHAPSAVALRRDGRPLVPFAGFGSSLLRI